MRAPRLSPLKVLERLAKRVLAIVLSVLFFRPGRVRRSRAVLASETKKRVLVVRIDNRVGEALLTTPLLEALKDAGHEVHLLAHPKMRRVLEGHRAIDQWWNFEKSWALISALRARRFDVVINAGNWDEPAVTSAVVSRLIGAHASVLGPANRSIAGLMDVAVLPEVGTRAEAQQRRWLASPLVKVEGPARLSFREVAPFSVVDGPYAVVNPGGRLGFRRVAPERFAVAARVLLDKGITPLVTWGPGEEPLVDAVLALAPGAVRAPPTSIDQLAALMRDAVVTVCNNTGPMHLSVAVGCPTLALFVFMEVERWGHAYAPHLMVDLALKSPLPSGEGQNERKS